MILKRFLLILVSLFLLSSCVESMFGKNIMLEPFSNVESVRLYSIKSKDIKLSKEQKDAILAEMSRRLKSPWYQYFGKISSACLVLTINGRSFYIHHAGRVEASTGGHGGAVSVANIAPDSILKKLYDESERCY